MAKKIEDSIRDSLAIRLDLFSDDLELVGKNFHIKKTDLTGDRYIDILCATKSKYIIIELKRTNQAARQALHEVCKYIEGIMSEKGVKKSEVEAYIVSTEWDELLIPFSLFVSEVDFVIKGYSLDVDDNYAPYRVQEVIPIDIVEGRFFSRFQDLRMFIDYSFLDINIGDYFTLNKSRGFDDFVIIVFDIPKEYNDACRNQFIKAMQQVGANENSCNGFDLIEMSKKIPDYTHALYGGFKTCSIDHYKKVLNKNLWNKIDAEDNSDDIEFYEEKAVYNISDSVKCDHLEISYPAKLLKMLEQGWTVQRVVRSGCFESNHILSDETIISELCGDRGTGGIHYLLEGNLNDKSTLSELKYDLNSKIFGDKTWISHINFILSYYSKSSDRDLRFKIDFLMPNNFLIGVYYQIMAGGINESTPFYIPNYCLRIDEYSDDIFLDRKIYAGHISYNGKISSFDDVLKEFYDGDFFKFALPLNWGGFIENDYEIMNYLGLSYKTLLYEHKTDINIIDNMYILENFKFKKIKKPFGPLSGFVSFIKQNEPLVDDLMQSLRKAHVGGMLIM